MQKVKVHCHICGDENPENFYRDKSRGSGFSSRCKKCNREYVRPIKRIKKEVKNPLSPDENLWCSQCKTFQRASDFYVNDWRATGRASRCKSCFRDNYYADRKRIKFQRIFKAFGITETRYFEILEAQGGACAICRQPEKSIRFKYLAVDHCHKTGKIRGLLCHRCNKSLGSLLDSIESLENAIEYLKKHQ